MLTASEQITNMIKSPVRQIEGRVDIYEGSTLLATYKSADNIKKFTIERVGDESKFAGYGICQKLNIHLIDKDRTLQYTTANTLDIAYGVNGEYTYPYPLFKISRVNRDDKTGELSITAYDALYQASEHTISEIEGWNGSYRLDAIAGKCAEFIGLTLKLIYDLDNSDNGFLVLTYPEGANLDGSETIREVLDAIAEVTHTIYFIDSENNLVFKRLLETRTIVVDAISRDDYYELDVGDNRRLTAIFHTTELGDNIEASLKVFTITQHPANIEAKVSDKVTFSVEAVGNGITYQWQYTTNNGASWIKSPLESASTPDLLVPVTTGRNGYGYRCIVTDESGKTLTSDAGYLTVSTVDEPIYTEGRKENSTIISGTTQYIRDNPFLELRDDIGAYLDNLIQAVGGFTITQFECKCRGNFLYEIGDRLWIKTKDGATNSNFYLLDDVVTYDGTLSEILKWKYNSTETETATNPTSLGDALKQTYARVDKANKQIELVASDVYENKSSIASLSTNVGSINATVFNIETNTANALSGINDSISTLTNKVDAQITAEDVSLSISTALDNGVTKVETETGFTFNEEGLTVSKSDSEISTQITEDGMKVYREEDAVLIANNVGVEARNLHATTYLIMGNNSRIEDYGSNRTGCFWIGGGE